MANKEKEANRQRNNDLLEYRAGPYLSQSALEYVVRKVNETGAPSAASRRSQSRAKATSVEEPTDYGPVLRTVALTIGGEPVDVTVLNGPAMLWRTLRNCAALRRVFKTALERHPCTAQRPWGNIMYWDEVSPTDPLTKGTDGREVQAVYFSFREFGNLLHMEDLWFVLAAARSSFVNKSASGMSNFVGMLMRGFFDPEGVDCRTSGIMLDLREDGDNSAARYRFFPGSLVHHRGLQSPCRSRRRSGP